MTLMLINVIQKLQFPAEWIVDILKVRFNGIYNDLSIPAIKHLCDHINFFTIVWR